MEQVREDKVKTEEAGIGIVMVGGSKMKGDEMLMLEQDIIQY